MPEMAILFRRGAACCPAGSLLDGLDPSATRFPSSELKVRPAMIGKGSSPPTGPFAETPARILCGFSVFGAYHAPDRPFSLGCDGDRSRTSLTGVPLWRRHALRWPNPSPRALSGQKERPGTSRSRRTRRVRLGSGEG
jgi:hypothetical protein